MTQPLAGRHVAVLLGGWLRTGGVAGLGPRCADALERLGAKVTRVDAGRDIAAGADASSSPTSAFNALHGAWGEDGCVQGVLETLADPLHPLRACWPRRWRWTRPSPRR